MQQRMLPKHIAIIMDGNGRWAKKRLQPRSFGHKKGVKNIFTICKYAFNLGIEAVTLYALSCENFSRPKEELDGLFDLFRQYFGKDKDKFLEMQVKIQFLGERDILPEDVRNCLTELEHLTAAYTCGILSICINYGAKQELIRAVNIAVERRERQTLQSFHNLLYTKNLPELDFVIRTGGDMRLSNFLLYQLAYAELYFTKKLWPDFSPKELDKALEDFIKRERRFGKTE